MMALKQSLFLLFAAVLLAGCASDQSAGVVDFQFDQSARSGSTYFATTHSVTVDLAEDALEPSFRSVIQYCLEDTRFNCTLLNSELAKRGSVSATLRARIDPEGVEQIVVLAAQDGLVSNRSTAVEDLAEPIIDMEARLSMLEKHLASLAELQERSANDVDSLLKITAEIAEAQSELENLRGEHAYLKLRTDLDEVTIRFGSYQNRSFFSPIVRSLQRFLDDLSEGIAQAITGFAFLLPWLVILVPIAVGVRRLLRRSK